MQAFSWISGQPLPDSFDLRREGWELVGQDDALCAPAVALVHARGLDLGAWSKLMARTALETRRAMLVTTVNRPATRVRLLEAGFGDVVGEGTAMRELHARAWRLAAMGEWMPRRRAIAALVLDVLTRDATYQGRTIGLHPREFAVLWRLAAHPGAVVSKAVLAGDLGRNGSASDANSMAVQLSRLRSKLSAMGLPGLVETTADGYRLRMPLLGEASMPVETPAMPLSAFIGSGLAPPPGLPAN